MRLQGLGGAFYGFVKAALDMMSKQSEWVNEYAPHLGARAHLDERTLTVKMPRRMGHTMLAMELAREPDSNCLLVVAAQAQVVKAMKAVLPSGEISVTHATKLNESLQGSNYDLIVFDDASVYLQEIYKAQDKLFACGALMVRVG